MSRTLRLAFRNKNGEAWYELYREACPICGHTGYCLIHQDQNKVVCTRVASDYEWGKSGQHHLHYLDGKNRTKKFNFEQVIEVKSHPKKKDESLNQIYRALLEELIIEENHDEHFKSDSRQLTDRQIAIRGYKSCPRFGRNIIERISKRLGCLATDLFGTPGVYLYKNNDREFVSLKGFPSILIPFRNYQNEIIGFQHRVDEVKYDLFVRDAQSGLKATLYAQPNHIKIAFNGKVIYMGEWSTGKEWVPFVHNGEKLAELRIEKGMRYVWLSSLNKEEGTGAGNPTPVHVAVPTKKLENWQVGNKLIAKSVWLTEGPLKGDICSDLIEKLYDPLEIEDIGDTFICLPGVNHWRKAIEIMELMEVENVNIAVDADAASNPEVYKYLKDLAIELKKRGLTANLILWNEDDGKGLDDLFLSGRIPHIKRLF